MSNHHCFVQCAYRTDENCHYVVYQDKVCYIGDLNHYGNSAISCPDVTKQARLNSGKFYEYLNNTCMSGCQLFTII